MRPNLIPLLITACAGILVMLIQYWLRPMVSHGHLLRWVLNPAPNFLTGFGVPFAALILPVTSPRVKQRLFFATTTLAVLVLLWFEVEPPLLRGKALDMPDVLATLAGAALATVVYQTWFRPR